MVDNVTVGSVCAQSPSFMPELDGGKNKTQLIVNDIVAYLKNPSVYSLEKEGPLNYLLIIVLKLSWVSIAMVHIQFLSPDLSKNLV